MKKSFNFVIFLLIIIILTNPGHAQQPADLKNAIDSKTEELRQVHRQIEETQENLLKTGQKKRTLKHDLSRNNYFINQLRLSLRSNVITIDKLNLEIDSLDHNINETQAGIKLKNEAVSKIFREVQIKDEEDLIIIFFKNQSLAQSLDEVHALTETRTALSQNIKELQTLKQNLDDQFNRVAAKKTGIEREFQTSKVRKSLIEDQQKERQELLALTKNQEGLYEKLIDELAKRQTEIAKEIEELEAVLRRQINPKLLPPERPGVLGWPIERGYQKITQGYGATTFARYGYKGRWHNGIDLGGSIGTPILAAGEGLVLSIGDQDKYCSRGAYGRYVVVRHPNNLVTLYAHLSRQSVNPGDKVGTGEVIGYMGSTGYSTGPHLHFTVYDANTFKIRQSSLCGPMPAGGDINPSVYL